MNFKKIFIGTILSLIISFIFMCILAIVVYFANIQDRTVSQIVFALSALAVFLGAFFLARNIPGRGLLNGAILALCYFAVLLTVSVLVNGGVSVSVSNILRFLSTVMAGALGGILGINTSTKEAVV